MTPTNGSLLDRLVRGSRWSWRSERHGDRLPADLESTVMDLRSDDLLHAKQGRSTCRVRFDAPGGPLTVFLKRHYRLPWTDRLAALIHPDGRHSPAGAEWRNLRRARNLGVPVPEAVAAGERIGPWGTLQSYLMVEELTGCLPLHEAIPRMARSLAPPAFARWKRRVVAEMADLTALLHAARAFHKDLYLCHFYLDVRNAGARLHLIDLHRLASHRLTAPWWRWKDLGQLLFSTFGVEGIDDGDRLRFWSHYRRLMRPASPALDRRMALLKASRYLDHNRKVGASA